MQFFNKKVFLCFTLILSGWVQTAMAETDKTATTTANCPDIATISEEQLAKFTMTCANAALKILETANDATSTIAAAKMTVNALNLLIEADDADAPGLDDAEDKFEDVRAETVKQLKPFINNERECESALKILSKLDSEVRDILNKRGEGDSPCNKERSSGNCHKDGPHCICKLNAVNVCNDGCIEKRGKCRCDNTNYCQ
jgi:hypothetical protein